MLLAVLLALLTAFVLRLAPWWLSAAVVGGALLGALGLASLGGVTRAVGPLLLLFLSVGLVVTRNAYGQRRSRVAPARKKRVKLEGVKRTAGLTPDALSIPGYETLEKVGSGGMASVYRARRLSDHQIVALKIPMEQYVADAKFIRRFHREAEVAQRLDHVNIVRTFEHGSIGVKHYMAMEFVDGRSLESYIEASELTVAVSVEVMKLVVGALQHIHSAGIIHRDIKPANIMVMRGGVRPHSDPPLAHNAVKLMDFGIAGGKVLSRLTMTGARVGTPIYMSPEQARGLKLDHRSDIYSLGLVFYELLTGQTAFKGGYEAIVHQQIFQTPPPPRQLNLDIPKALDALIMRMIAKDPDERPRLDEVLATLNRNDLEDDVADVGELPSRLVVTVNTRQGVLRILDTAGTLHSSVGDIGVGEGCFSAAPLAVALDRSGHIYAAIFEYRIGGDEHRMIHKLSPDGRPLMSFGAYGMKPGEFLYPTALATSADERVYALDAETHLVQCFDTHGCYLMNFGGRGVGRGLFNDPRGLAVAPSGTVYVLDYGNRQVQQFDPEGRYQTRWAFKQSADSDEMRLLDGLTVDRHNNLYVSDGSGSKIRRITPKGKVALSYSFEPLQGEASDALLDLGVDEHGNLYAARRGGHLIRKFDPSGKLIATFETYAPVLQMLLDIRAPTIQDIVQDTVPDLRQRDVALD